MPGAVLVVEDDADLLDSLTVALELLCGRSSLCVSGYRELVELGPRALACELAILDVNLGPGLPSGLDALRWLRDHNFGGRICFLTGHATSHPLVDQAVHRGDAMVLRKPIAADMLKALVDGTK